MTTSQVCSGHKYVYGLDFKELLGFTVQCHRSHLAANVGDRWCMSNTFGPHLRKMNICWEWGDGGTEWIYRTEVNSPGIRSWSWSLVVTCPVNPDTLVIVGLVTGLHKGRKVIREGEDLEGQWKAGCYWARFLINSTFFSGACRSYRLFFSLYPSISHICTHITHKYKPTRTHTVQFQHYTLGIMVVRTTSNIILSTLCSDCWLTLLPFKNRCHYYKRWVWTNAGATTEVKSPSSGAKALA